MDLTKSLALWDQRGRHVLMATAYKDQIVVEARDCSFLDADGNEYLDLSAGQICSIVGHGHPLLVQRVLEQVRRCYHTGTSFLSPVVLEASERVAAVAPGALSRCLFLSTGAEANEYAVRLAKTVTGKTGVLAMTKGYAGLTLQTASLTNYGKGATPIVPGTGYLLVPDPTMCPPGCEPLDWGRELLAESLELNRGLLDDVAAIVVEPILSAGGLIVLPDGYLRELRQLADRLGALLIADEAQTGMGRTGRWFGVEHDGVEPDVLVLSKGVGGGFPSAVVVTTDDIAARALGRVNQFSSHQSDPLAAAATLAVIEIIERERLVEAAARKGEHLRRRLDHLALSRPALRNVRGRGLMVGFDVFRDPDRPVPDPAVGRGIEDFCRSRGVHFQAIQKNRFRILPPLTIAEEALDRFVDTLAAALDALAAGQLAPVPALNPQTAQFEARAQRGVKAAVRWAWTHSPQQWATRLAEKRKRSR